MTDRVPTLFTSRLALRGWGPADVAPFAAINADPIVMEHLPGVLTQTQTEAYLDRITEHFQRHGFGLWAVERRDTARLIGFVGLTVPSFEAHFTPCVEIGWRLSRDAWGHGFATEAARVALEHGFGEAGLREIVSFTVPANVRSIAVMERLGMQRDPAGDFGHPRVPKTHPLHAHVLYRMPAAAFFREERVRGIEPLS